MRIGAVHLFGRALGDPRNAALGVGVVLHRQVAGALGVEEEEGAEDEGEGGGLQLSADRVVFQVAAVALGPAPQLQAEYGQHLLAQGAVEAQSQLGAVVASFAQNLVEAALCEVSGGEQAEQGSVVGLQLAGVQLQVAVRNAAVVARGSQQPHARAGGEQPVRGVVRFACDEQRPLRQAPRLVEPGELLGGAMGVDDERRPPLRLREEAAARQLRHLVAKRLERLPPTGRGDVRRESRQLRPAVLAVPQPVAIQVACAKTADDQTRDAGGVEPLQLLGEAPDRLNPAEAGGLPNQREERLGADTAQWPVPLRSEHPHMALFLGIVGDQQQGVRAATLAFLPRGTDLAFLGGCGAAELDAVDDTALGHAVGRPRIPAPRDRLNSVE